MEPNPYEASREAGYKQPQPPDGGPGYYCAVVRIVDKILVAVVVIWTVIGLLWPAAQ